MGRKIDNKLGEIRLNNMGTKMEIINYNGTLDMDIKFYHEINGKQLTYIRKNVQYGNFESGTLKSPYDITIRDFGYIGVGKYDRRYKDEEGNIILTKEFVAYEKMIMNCEKDNCTMYNKWMDFQQFAEWYNSVSYDCSQKLKLTRLSSVIASPSNCVLLPHSVFTQYNKIFTGRISVNRFMSYLEKWEDIIPDNEYSKLFSITMELMYSKRTA